MEQEDKSARFLAAFYLVENLERPASPRLLRDLRGFRGDKLLAPNLAPLGPVIVRW